MAGNPPYQSKGAGGKFPKNPSRRNIKTTLYDRPIINDKKIQNPSWITKIVNPASRLIYARLIYAGAKKLFGAFRNRLLPSEINEEPKNVLQVTEKRENSASIAAATGISELEQVLQQKTFTRTESQRLTALLHSRTTELPSDDVVERDGAKPHSSPSPILRPEASTSGSRKRHGDERDNFYAGISTPAVSSKGLENGFVTPRSRGRSAMYRMGRIPYARSSTSTLKAIKRRSSVLDDDIGSGGPLRRTRQKANVLSRDSEKSEAPHQARIHTSREPASKGKDKIEENGYRHDRRESSFKGKEKIEENGSSKFPSRSIYNSANGEMPVLLKDNAPNVPNTHSPLKVPSGSPQKKRAFQMIAPDDSFEIDDDEVHVNGHDSFPLVENKKAKTSLVANKLDAANSIESPKLPQVPKTPALLVNNESVSAEVPKFSEQAELKEAENATASKTNYGIFSEPGRGMKLPPSTTSTQTSVLLQSNLQTEKVASEKSSSPSPFLFDTTVKKESPSQLSVKEPSVFKFDATSDPKAPESNRGSSKEDNGNGNDQNSANMLGTSELKSSAVPLATSTNNILSFGNPTNTISTPNTTSASNAPAFPSINGTFSFGNPANNASNAASASSAPALASLVPVQTAGTDTNSLFSNISPNVVSASTSTPMSTTTATAATTNFFSTSASLPVFSFGSTATPTSMAETGNNNNATNDKELRSNTRSLPLTTTSFATTTTTGSGLFGFSSPAVASTSTAQGSFFSVTNGSQANTSASTAVTKSGPFQFGSPSPFAAPTPTFGASATPVFGASASPAFGTSAPAFGASATPAFGASAPAFGSFAPSFGSSASFGLMAASSEGKSGNTTCVSTTSIFGSTWQAPPSSGSGSMLGCSPSSTVFSFGLSSTPMPSTTTSPIVFGASNTAASFMTTGATNSSFSGPSVFGNSAPVFRAATLSPNNNDQMSLEDSMAALEDSMAALSLYRDRDDQMSLEDSMAALEDSMAALSLYRDRDTFCQTNSN